MLLCDDGKSIFHLYAQFKRNKKPIQVKLMQIPPWFSEIRFAFSRKDDGQMSFKREKKDIVRNNRHHFLTANSLNINQLVSSELVHGVKIAIVGSDSVSTNMITISDGLVTSERGILLSTTHADCLPVVLFDRMQNVIGQAHCGWRGLQAGIISELIDTFRNHRNSKATSIQAWIGPGIGAECYTVSKDVAEKFPAQFINNTNGNLNLDLIGFARSELISNGVPTNNITLSNVCTSCQNSFSSYRRDGDGFNAMLLVTGLM